MFLISLFRFIKTVSIKNAAKLYKRQRFSVEQANNFHFFFLGFSRCDKAEPAADFDAFPVRLLRRTPLAVLATFLLVTFFPPGIISP